MVWRLPDSKVQESVGIHTILIAALNARRSCQQVAQCVKQDGIRNGSKQDLQTESRLKRAEMKAQNIKPEATHGSWRSIAKIPKDITWDAGIVIQPAFRQASQNAADGRRALCLQRPILPTTYRANGEESRSSRTTESPLDGTAFSSTPIENSAECLCSNNAGRVSGEYYECGNS